jgi:DNA polymerase (family 10)
MEEDVKVAYEHGRLKDVPGVGDAIEGKIIEIIKTGELRYLADLKAEFPEGLVQIMQVQEIGPKTAMHLYQELGITDIQDLKEAAEMGRIRHLKGFGERTEENILKGIRYLEQTKGRMLLGRAHPIASGLVAYLREKGGMELVDFAGSLRRMKETILIGSDQPERATEMFLSYPDIEDVMAKGPTRSSIRLRSGTQVDLRVVPVQSYGAALQYFTGSKEHNVAVRAIAIEKGFKLNEYGLFRKDTEELVAARTEADIYAALDMALPPPEVREDQGEIEAALRGQVPTLVELKDIKGDLHVHTNASDGSHNMEDMARAAMDRGYQYVGISDHSGSLRIANGLDEGRLKKNIAEAARLSEKMAPFRVLIGAEVEIDERGRLDYPDKTLSDLDYVIGAVHSRFKMSESEMTVRLLTALSNEHISILAHPTGRLIGQREPYSFDTEQVFHRARESSVFLEVNAFPERMDLNDGYCRIAKERGNQLVISTDSHGPSHLDNIVYGLAMARRGWIGPEQVINTLPLNDIIVLLDH